jgi:hypothetical protein
LPGDPGLAMAEAENVALSDNSPKLAHASDYGNKFPAPLSVSIGRKILQTFTWY